MEPSTLQEILGVEKQIRQQLDAERTQASQWLENARREIETAHRAEMEALKREAGQGEGIARQAASEKAALVVQRAEETARAVDNIADEELRRRLRGCLAALVPEGSGAR